MDKKTDYLFGGVGALSGAIGYDLSNDNEILQTIFLILSILNLLAVFLPRIMALIGNLIRNTKNAYKTGKVDKEEQANIIAESEKLKQDFENEMKEKENTNGLDK